MEREHIFLAITFKQQFLLGQLSEVCLFERSIIRTRDEYAFKLTMFAFR